MQLNDSFSFTVTSNQCNNIHTDMLYLLHGENIFSGSCMLQQRMELYLWSDLNTNTHKMLSHTVNSHSQ